ncbi:hypothetical protein FCV25MIE_33784 [Fagus crenata]
MAGKLSSFRIGAIVLLLSFVIFGTQSHPSNTLKLASSSRGMEGPVDGLSRLTIKHSGPNRVSGGLKSSNTRILAQVRDSGPSPGEGHKHLSHTH